MEINRGFNLCMKEGGNIIMISQTKYNHYFALDFNLFCQLLSSENTQLDLEWFVFLFVFFFFLVYYVCSMFNIKIFRVTLTKTNKIFQLVIVHRVCFALIYQIIPW